MKQCVVLLATDDSAVEASVVALTRRAECGLNCVKTSREALSIVVDGAMDGFLNQDIAVLDLDLGGGGRALLRTAGGLLPVIAIASEAKPWLSAMLRRRRVRASLTKPVSLETLSAAFECVRRTSTMATPHAR
jgi:DNA-binding response OmpR family regulator